MVNSIHHLDGIDLLRTITTTIKKPSGRKKGGFSKK